MKFHVTLHEAVSQISEIHAQLLKSEVFRGYRSWPAAVTGALALCGAALQSQMSVAPTPFELASTWLGIAALCAALCLGDLARGYARSTTANERRRTLHAFGQFAPALVAGAIVTTALLDHAAELLPGLWSILYALGLFASRLYLPRHVGWFALWFLSAGAMLLARPDLAASPWGMGLTFGCGQLGLAYVLRCPVDRHGDSRGRA